MTNNQILFMRFVFVPIMGMSLAITAFHVSISHYWASLACFTAIYLAFCLLRVYFRLLHEGEPKEEPDGNAVELSQPRVELSLTLSVAVPLGYEEVKCSRSRPGILLRRLSDDQEVFFDLSLPVGNLLKTVDQIRSLDSFADTSIDN